MPHGNSEVIEDPPFGSAVGIRTAAFDEYTYQLCYFHMAPMWMLPLAMAIRSCSVYTTNSTTWNIFEKWQGFWSQNAKPLFPTRIEEANQLMCEHG
jgi:glycogen debranching enzyme